MSIALVQFEKLAKGDVIKGMQTITETRLARLNLLIKSHNNSLANLNEAIGLDRTDATLSQIRTRAPHSKSGKPRSMGDDLARKIELRLKLTHGWMDTPPTYAELNGAHDPSAALMSIMQNLPPELYPTAIRLVAALVQPTIEATGTGGK